MRLDKTSTVEVQEDHLLYRFLATTGVGQAWVHCAMCGSQNDGRFQGGRPRYSGGLLQALDRDQVWDFACRCHQGQRFHDKQHLPYCDEAPESVDWLTRPMWILWVRGSSPGTPPKAQPLDFDVGAYLETYALAFAELMAGKIDKAELVARTRKLESALDTGIRTPTVREVLESRALRSLYFDGAYVSTAEGELR